MNKPLVLEEFGLPRDSVMFDRKSSTTLRDRYYGEIFEIVKEHAIQKVYFKDVTFGLGEDLHNHSIFSGKKEMTIWEIRDKKSRG